MDLIAPKLVVHRDQRHDNSPCDEEHQKNRSEGFPPKREKKHLRIMLCVLHRRHVTDKEIPPTDY